MKPMRANEIALCLAVLLLSACSGGGNGEIVRTSPPPPPPTPPPPPPPSGFNPCPAPVTADCDVSLTTGAREILPATSSDHALILRGDGRLDLTEARYRFSNGTRIEGGSLMVGGILQSSVAVGAPGRLMVWGSIEGNVSNLGSVELGGTIGNNLHNAGRVEVSGAVYGNAMRVGGDFVQSSPGTLLFALAPAGWDGPAPLQVDGRAVLAGTLQLGVYTDGWGPYPMPAARAHHLIHANGGVSGQFAGWTSPGLAITGELRYGANDVWFDLARISVQAAMMKRGVDRALPLASASNLDRALAGADAFALAPQASLDAAQRRFLASASSLLWLQDTAQAERSFDSLSGHAHAAMNEVLHRQGGQASAQLDARIARQRFAAEPVPWAQGSHWRSGGHGLDGQSTGIDRWLSPRLLVGSGVSHGRASLRFDSLGGRGWSESPGVSLFAHYRGDGWHATGALGAGRTSLQLQRPIELGGSDRHVVHARRGFDHAFLHGELGRDVPLGEGRLVPFVAFDHGIVRGDAFAEQGDTGMELVAASSRQARFSGAVGARYARDWSLGRHRLWLELDARHRRERVDGDPLRAAFRGVPDVRFELPDARAPATGDLRVGLGGSRGPRLRWSMDYSRGFGGEHRDEGWILGVWRAF